MTRTTVSNKAPRVPGVAAEPGVLERYRRQFIATRGKFLKEQAEASAYGAG